MTEHVLKYQVSSADAPPGGAQAAGRRKLRREAVLYQPWPNPSRNRFNISYSLPMAGRATVKVYDICGREVCQLVDEEQKPGEYSLVWNGKDNRGRTVAAGVYFCSMKTEGKSQSKKVVLAR